VIPICQLGQADRWPRSKGTGSLLGGDARWALIRQGQSAAQERSPGPVPRDCDQGTLMVCARGGGKLQRCGGRQLEQRHRNLSAGNCLPQADREQILPQVASTTRSFDATSKEKANLFLKKPGDWSGKLNAAVR